MPAPVRPIGETRKCIVEYLEKTGRPMTWPQIRTAVGITAGYRTQKRMLDLGQIRRAGVDALGVKLFVVGSRPIRQTSTRKKMGRTGRK
jgi:hypothetical protein